MFLIYKDPINGKLINTINSRQILSLKTQLDLIVKKPEVQAELLNEFYYTVFRTDNGQPIPTLPISSAMMGISVFTRCLSTLDNSMSPGHDQLHPRLLKRLATFLAEPFI